MSITDSIDQWVPINKESCGPGYHVEMTMKFDNNHPLTCGAEYDIGLYNEKKNQASSEKIATAKVGGAISFSGTVISNATDAILFSIKKSNNGWCSITGQSFTSIGEYIPTNLKNIPFFSGDFIEINEQPIFSLMNDTFLNLNHLPKCTNCHMYINSVYYSCPVNGGKCDGMNITNNLCTCGENGVPCTLC
jgi:hypothetical protein